jgi:hypothetical protein
MLISKVGFNSRILQKPPVAATRFGDSSPSGEGVSEYLAAEQKRYANAPVEYAVVSRAKKEEPKRLQQEIPRVDYSRNFGLEGVAKVFAVRQFQYRGDQPGEIKTFTGKDVLKSLVTAQAVPVSRLDSLNDRGSMEPHEYEALGKSNHEINQTVLPALGMPKVDYYAAVKAAQREGLVYRLIDTAKTRNGFEYYGVPLEVRNAAGINAAETQQPGETPRDKFVTGLKTFLDQPEIPRITDGELFDAITTVARSAASFQTNLDGFKFGDIPEAVMHHKWFANTNETRLDSALLSLLEASSFSSPDKVFPQAQALCKQAIAAEILDKGEYNETMGLIQEQQPDLDLVPA